MHPDIYARWACFWARDQKELESIKKLFHQNQEMLTTVRASKQNDSAIALSLVLWNGFEKGSPDWMKKHWERHQQKSNGIKKKKISSNKK